MIVPLADALTDRTTLPSPRWLDAATDQVWVRRDDRRLVGLDHRNGSPSVTFALGDLGRPCQGVAANKGSLYACEAGSLVLLGSDSGRVLASSPVLLAVEPHENRLLAKVSGPGLAGGGAIGAFDALRITDPGTNQVLRLDPSPILD